MRILMTADPVGGVWTYALALASGLQHHSVEVVLAVMGGRITAAQREQAAAAANVTVVDAAFRLEWMEDPWRDVAAAGDWLLGLARDVRPDVVHLNGFAHGALPWPAPAVVVAHSCVLSWWRAVHGQEAPAEWQRYRDVVTAGVRSADALVAPTRAMLDSAVRDYGPIRNARVIHNGSAAVVPAVADAVCVDRAQPATATQPFVLAAGRVWDASKNLRVLADAAPSIGWPVYVAGAFEHPDGGRVDLPGVQLLGPLAPRAMQAWHERASIFVHPAVYEPFGLVPLEAALTGSALVLGDIPSLREVWADAAVYVPSGDADALAAAVNRLAADPRLLASRAAAAQERARSFSVSRMAAAYHELYRELLDRRSPPRTRSEVGACA